MELIKTTENGIMKFKTMDAVAGNVLAEILEVEHSKMMRTIKRVMQYEAERKSHGSKVSSETRKDNATSGGISRENISPSKYQSRGKNYDMFRLDKAGTLALLLSFKGEKYEAERKSHGSKVSSETRKDNATSGGISDALKIIDHEKDELTSERISKTKINHIPEENNPNFNAVFKEWEYTDSMNRKRKTYIMNEDAFYLVIANTRGQKAHEVKVWFKSEFNDMREERHIRAITKTMRRNFTDHIKDLQAYAEKQRNGKPYPMIYTNYTKMIYKALGITVPPKGSDRRDHLTAGQLARVEQLEADVSGLIEDLMEEEMHYKEIYEYVKNSLSGRG